MMEEREKKNEGEKAAAAMAVSGATTTREHG